MSPTTSSHTHLNHLSRRQRNALYPHSPETLEYLIHFNDYIGLYLWYGLIGIIAVVAIPYWIQKLQGFLRRRDAGFRAESKRLPRSKSRDPDVMDDRKRSVRFGWYWLGAFWRKYSIKHSKIAEIFFLGDVGQLLLIVVYLLLNFLLIFLGTAGDIDWMAHHAAKLTYANLPLIIGLAGKNNILSKVTGFAYEALNVLHRWSARFVIVSSAIHIGGRTYTNVPSVRMGVAGSGYIAWGWVAFALFIYMIAAASRKIRNAAYQFFLIQHLILWFVIVASLIIHRPQEQGWIWAAFALHLLDRIGRGCRIAYYHALRTVSGEDERPKGEVTVLTEDTIRVSVRTRQNWIPGQHVYLHCPKESPGGHPFTVSNISRPMTQTDNHRPKEAVQEILIRVREGMTKKVYEAGMGGKDIESAGSKGEIKEPLAPVPIKVWSEGPYGHEKYLGEDFNTLLLVAGGSGVSYTLSNAMDLVRRARAMHLGSKDKSIAIAVKRLSFLWMVKKPEQVNWIADHLREMCDLAPPGFLHITIFVTSKRKSGETLVLPGYVTLDRRDPIESEKNSQRDEPNSTGRDVDAEQLPERLRSNGNNDRTAETPRSPSPPGPGRTERTGSDSTLNDQQVAEIQRDKPVRIMDTAVRDKAENVTHAAMVELRSGRPDFPELIEREIKATEYADWFAIGGCGPLPMTDSLADAASRAVKPTQVLRGELRRNIYLTIEEFGW